jgi:hypothetical protein
MTHPFEVFGGKLSDGLLVLDSFTDVEADEIAYRIIEQRSHWTNREWFWTLGASAYIDTPEDYQANAGNGNIILTRHFSEAIGKVIHDVGRIAKTSAGPLENPDGHEAEASLPGFHIVNNKANGRSGSLHVDMPYQRVYWPGPFNRPFTFTTLISQPEVGAGLWYWDDMGYEDGKRYIREADTSRTAQNVPEEGRELLTYEIGKTYVYSGRVPHAIADMGNMEEGEYRITLQGHGAYLPEQDYLGLYF